MSNNDKLKEAIVIALFTDDKVFLNKNEYIGIVASSIDPIPNVPEQYLTVGNFSKESWPFNTQAERVEIINIKSGPVHHSTRTLPDSVSMLFSDVVELWSIDDKMNPLKRLYKREPIFSN
ncbi:MAG: hypothetical protein JWM14_1498 [Chitinophagaceae bacterium]|nr:hypothetical protein [Chitinophagaceae bacterium]